ncbi:MAG: signal peptidase II [Deltaproteobacteria bacterium]
MRRLLTFLVLSIACIGCDQGTKHIAASSLRGRPTMSFLADTFRLQYAENPGAFLGLGSSMPEGWRFAIFVAGSGLLVLGTIAFMFARRNLARSQFIALTLLAAGGIGNLIDRFVGDGRVIDFMNVGVGPVRTGIFNVADIAIMGGMLWMLVVGWREEPKEAAPETAASA